MKRALVLVALSLLACKKPAPKETPKPDPVASVSASASATPVPPQQACEGANIDLDWVLASPTCTKEYATPPPRQPAPAGLTMELAPPATGAVSGAKTPILVTFTNTTDAPMPLVIEGLHVYAFRSDGSRYDMPEGMIGLLGLAPDRKAITIAPKGHAVGTAQFSATGFMPPPPPPKPSKKKKKPALNLGESAPLPAGTYKLGIDPFPSFIDPPAITGAAQIDVH